MSQQPSPPGLQSRVAHAGFESHRYFGQSVFDELLGRENALGLMSLALGGPRLDAEAVRVLDAVAVASTVADPRIWPLKAIRLAASFGSPLTGCVTAFSLLENAQIGPWVVGESARALQWLRTRVGDESLEHEPTVELAVKEYLALHPKVLGYGIPFRAEDERLVALRQHLGAHLPAVFHRPFWRLHECFNRILMRERRLPPNMGAGSAALLLDLGYTPEQAAMMYTSFYFHIFVAHAVEGAEQRASSLQCLPPESVEYLGPPPRRSPRARQASGDSEPVAAGRTGDRKTGGVEEDR